MNKEQKTSQTTEPAIAVEPVLAPVFTWEDFKKYVEIKFKLFEREINSNWYSR